jgi:hypothetical protein
LHLIVNNISICFFHMHVIWFCFLKNTYMKLIHRYQNKCSEIIIELPLKHIASVNQQINYLNIRSFSNI